VDQDVWKESKWEDADKKDIGSYNRFKGGIHTKKRESLFLVQRRKRESKGVYSGADEKGIYLTVRVTTDYAGILCKEEEWEKENGIRLLVS